MTADRVLAHRVGYLNGHGRAAKNSYETDDALDRTALARRNLELLRSRGAPTSVIVEQLGRVLPICPVCAVELLPAGRETCSRSCANRLRWQRRNDAVCAICGEPRRPERRTCSRSCANVLRGRVLRERAHPARKKAAV